VAAIVMAALKDHAKNSVASQKPGRDPGARLGEIQERLKLLLQRMQRAALTGDLRAAAILAREAAGLARDLTASVEELATAPQAAGMAFPGGQEPQDGSTGVSVQLSILNPLDPGLILETSKALTLLRSILGMARGVVTGQSGFEAEEESILEFRKALAKAEQALDDSANSLQAMMGP
jgi:hypothetical protein